MVVETRREPGERAEKLVKLKDEGTASAAEAEQHLPLRRSADGKVANLHSSIFFFLFFFFHLF